MAGLKSSAEVKATEVEGVAAPMTIQRMVQDYLDDPNVGYLDQNLLVYWYGKMQQWTELSRQAIKYLSCPVARASSECMFIASCTVVTVRRTCLSPQNMERLTMIKIHQHHTTRLYCG